MTSTLPDISQMPVETPEQFNAVLDIMETQREAFSKLKVEDVRRIASNVAKRIMEKRVYFAQATVDEGYMGNAIDKCVKISFGVENVTSKYIHEDYCSPSEFNEAMGIQKFYSPHGIVACITPCTNVVSTIAFKALLCILTRNSCFIAQHPRCHKIAAESVRCIQAAITEVAPEFTAIVACTTKPSLELTSCVINSKRIAYTMATGGPAMLQAVNISEVPSVVVGAGNTPVLVDETADYEMAVNYVIMSKTFDNGVVCASEQSMIIHESLYEKCKTEFIKRGAVVLNEEEKAKVAAVIIKPNGALNAAVVGQTAHTIATMAGVDVPVTTRVLVAECTDICDAEAFSHEKLSPTLGLYSCPDFDTGLAMAEDYVSRGGIGHTSVLYVEPTETEKIMKFGEALKTGRIIMNSPASQGAIGDLWNFSLPPSLTLGVGTWGGSSTSENVGPMSLVNVKTVAMRRENMLWFRAPPRVYFKYGCLPIAMTDFKDYKKAFIITDKFLFNFGYCDKVTDELDKYGIQYQIFMDVEPDPKYSTIERALTQIRSFQPDVFIALGGGSPLDAAKVMRLYYEHPELKFEDLALRFLDIRKRIFHFPTMNKTDFVAIATTSGTGSEVTPFAVITAEENGVEVKYPLADYAMTPTVAITDAQFCMTLPKFLSACTGMDALTHATEALVSILATDFTSPLALRAVKMVFDNLHESVHQGTQLARENMHHAATIAGMAFANAFLGINHSIAHKLGQKYHVPHGLANAVMFPAVVLYNSNPKPSKMGCFPQYTKPVAQERYAEVMRYMGHSGSDEELVYKLVEETRKLITSIDIPLYLEDCRGVPSFEQLCEDLDSGLAEYMYDDQCTGANPITPNFEHFKTIVKACYNEEKWNEISPTLRYL
ncbi:hypothetical protein PCE1_001157 [Barthelona sp. PCE]